MVKADYPYLMHILDAINAINEYAGELLWPDFQKNRMVQDAVIRQIQIMGDAAKLVSSDLKKKHPELPWNKMAGMRDKLIHQYFGVDNYLLWQTAVIHVPKLKGDLERLIHSIK